ncbi:unnamed protein product [Brachionus calyciflorus]|uniref:Uncharacterized protein n=1 Tax=Brachionus calyciflorus TaxID=104777 RepID=A0A814N3S2_9BILA|nr:unnamed protein product [Brachionus calyciflorus]
MINDLSNNYYVFGFLLIALTITIFGLDTTITTKSYKSGSIAFENFFNYGTGFSFFLGILYIFGISIVGCLGSGEKIFLFFSTGLLFFIGIPREAINYKFFVCFNYSYYQIVQARASLTFISIIVLFVMLILQMKSTDKYDNDQKLKITFRYNFIKDSNYDLRIISSLYDIIDSKNKEYGNKSCHESYDYYIPGPICTINYLRKLNVEITCNSETENFYSDCMTAQEIKIQMKYKGGYPIYNCGFVDKNGLCNIGCPGLMNHKLFLVQEFNNRVELGWDGFSNCEVKSPKIELTEDKALNICAEN